MQLRAIVIDDNEACRSLLTFLLEKRGYEVVCLPDPTACPLYKKTRCSCPQDAVCGDFLLSDNQMPFMSGLELIERQVQGGCKGLMGNKALLSAAWSEEDVLRARKLGCKIFDKPYPLADIEAWLDMREPQIPADRNLVDFQAMSGGIELAETHE